MRHLISMAMLAWAVALGTCLAAAEPDPLAELDEALKAVPAFEHGQESAPLVAIENMVFHLPTDSKLRGPVEGKLLAALESAKTGDAKRFLCRQLRVIGTAQCVPHLEKLLTDPEVSHGARRALGLMEDPAAAAALHLALSKTTGKLQAGIINTLANRRYMPAQPDFDRLLDSPDADVAQAAARALGCLGDVPSLVRLKVARNGASPELAREIENALLNCAALLAAKGKAAEAAASVYEPFYISGRSEQLRFAGLRGLVVTGSDKAADVLVTAIKSNDARLRRFAISLLDIPKGEQATKTFVPLLTSLSAEDEALMLHALGARGDATAASAIIAATKSEDEAVRMAALESLGCVGGAAIVGPLAQGAAAAEGAAKLVARASLRRLKGDDVDRTLRESLKTGDAKVRVEVIHALAARKQATAVGALLAAAHDEDASVRQEAVRAVGMLAGESDLRPLVALLVKPKDAGDRSAVEQAVGKTILRIQDKSRAAQAVLDALANAPDEAKPGLVRLLSKPATPEALRAVRHSLKSASAPVQDAGVQALSDWPDASATQDLIALIADSKNQAHKQLALKGYVRLAGLSDDPTAMLMRVLKSVDRAGDKKLVLEGLGLNSDSPEALKVVLGYVNDKQLQAAAGIAVLRIAYQLRDKDPGLARSSLKQVLKTVKHPDVQKRALEVFNELDKEADHILQWVVAGPFTLKGKDGAEVYKTVFEPEKPGAKDVEWKALTKGIGSWAINLEATYGNLDNVGAYVRTQVFSPLEQQALLEMGSDDAVKAWVNSKQVFERWVNHGAEPRQERVPVKLLKGWNELMIKVVDQTGGWVVGARLRKPDGTALEGLKIEAK